MGETTASARTRARRGAATGLLAVLIAAPSHAQAPEAPTPVPVACPVPPAAPSAPEPAAALPGPPSTAPPLEPEPGPADSLGGEDSWGDVAGPEPSLDAPLPEAPAAEPLPVSLSIGTPDAGLLVNPVPMLEGPLWKLRDARESYGTTETVAFIRAAIEAVDGQFPGSPRLVIGDISRADGGRLNRHASHQSGRDADIGYYYKRGEVADFLNADGRSLDAARTWALVRAFVVGSDVERIFIDRSLQRVLYAHALAAGEDRAWLDDLFGRRTAGKGAIIQHERRHRNHMHVRFYNPQAQDCGRLAYRQLVESGLVPPPRLRHRIRSGETLSSLARRYGVRESAIRAANGMKGSFLRAGRTLVIPVRRVPQETAAVVVPPRRLPPGTTPAVADNQGDSALR